MRSRIVFTIVMTVLLAATQPFAIASDSDLVVENIQDVAYTLQRIRQQAVNIYVECTRKPVNHYELNIVSLCSVPSTALEGPGVYLPLRKAWLVFFIGTMEPLVQILNEHLKHIDERTQQRHIPDKCLAEWQGLVGEWKNTVKQLNAQLDVCAALVNDPEPCNIKVAESARSIDQQVTQLNRILHKGSKFLHDNLPPPDYSKRATPGSDY